MSYIPDKEAFGVYKLLAQVVPAVANAPEIVFSPNANEEVHITLASLVNYNNQDIDFVLYQDDDGTTYDDSTTIGKGSISRDETGRASAGTIFMNNSTGSVGVKVSNTNCTITLWGVVYDLS